MLYYQEYRGTIVVIQETGEPIDLCWALNETEKMGFDTPQDWGLKPDRVKWHWVEDAGLVWSMCYTTEEDYLV